MKSILLILIILSAYSIFKCKDTTQLNQFKVERFHFTTSSNHLFKSTFTVSEENEFIAEQLDEKEDHHDDELNYNHPSDFFSTISADDNFFCRKPLIKYSSILKSRLTDYLRI